MIFYRPAKTRSERASIWRKLRNAAPAVLLAIALSVNHSFAAPGSSQRRGPASVADRLAQFGKIAERRWKPYFEKAGLEFPPASIVLVGLKEERRLEVYGAAERGGGMKFIRSLPILAASGGPGPKLRQGDGQVPEGFYRIELLNPNSLFHLSLRVNYPNEADRRQARIDGRTQLGGDIMIHGNQVSIGCLAMGDEGAEDLFVLAAKVGLKQISVILAPQDLRVGGMPEDPERPQWVSELYREIREALMRLPSGAVKVSSS